MFEKVTEAASCMAGNEDNTIKQITSGFIFATENICCSLHCTALVQFENEEKMKTIHKSTSNVLITYK